MTQVHSRTWWFSDSWPFPTPCCFGGWCLDNLEISSHFSSPVSYASSITKCSHLHRLASSSDLSPSNISCTHPFSNLFKPCSHLGTPLLKIPLLPFTEGMQSALEACSSRLPGQIRLRAHLSPSTCHLSFKAQLQAHLLRVTFLIIPAPTALP